MIQTVNFLLEHIFTAYPSSHQLTRPYEQVWYRYGMMAQISTAKGTMVFEMDVGFPYAERTFYEGMKEDKLSEFPELVLNVNKGTQALKASAFPSSHRFVPKGIAISTGRGTGIRYL